MVVHLASEKGKRSCGRKSQKTRKVGDMREKEWATTRTIVKHNDKDQSDEVISMDELSRSRRIQPFTVINKRFIS
jgi:hypothetical protein